jgi:hypothetical protein
MLASATNHAYHYYECACHEPARARKFGKPVCALPAVPALPLEAEAWSIVSETLLDPEKLEAGLQAARQARGSADRVRRDQRGIIDAEIATRRRKLDNLTEQLEDVAGEAADAIRRRMQEHEQAITQLNQQVAALEAAPAEGLSDVEVSAIRDFAETARLGITHATPADRRELFDTLRLRATITRSDASDDKAIQLGRHHHFRVQWDAKIPLRHTGIPLENRTSRYGRKRWNGP